MKHQLQYYFLKFVPFYLLAQTFLIHKGWDVRFFFGKILLFLKNGMITGGCLPFENLCMESKVKWGVLCRLDQPRQHPIDDCKHHDRKLGQVHGRWRQQLQPFGLVLRYWELLPLVPVVLRYRLFLRASQWYVSQCFNLKSNNLFLLE